MKAFSDDYLEVNDVADSRENSRRRPPLYSVFCFSIVLALSSCVLVMTQLQFLEYSNTSIPPLGSIYCSSPTTRREWRTLSSVEQRQYISAVQCLMDKPSQLGNNGSRYDDFVWVHFREYERAHNVAAILPWHRYFIQVFEDTLKSECQFGGHLPYWDWTFDTDNPEHSPLWSNETGFGGTTMDQTGCVVDGNFAGFNPQCPRPHCLHRKFASGMLAYNYTTDIIEEVLNKNAIYHEFRVHFESGPHKSIHNGIGGEMPTENSPNDPIFWVHHAQVDRIWWRWQQQDPTHRLSNYQGPTDQAGLLDESGGWLHAASLQDIVSLPGLAPDKKVADVMSTMSRLLCYSYQ